MVGMMGISHTVLVPSNLHARVKVPASKSPHWPEPEMGEPYIAAADGLAIAGGKLIEHRLLLLLMGISGPGFYHVGILPGSVATVTKRDTLCLSAPRQSSRHFPSFFGGHIPSAGGPVTVSMLPQRGHLHEGIQSHIQDRPVHGLLLPIFNKSVSESLLP